MREAKVFSGAMALIGAGATNPPNLLLQGTASQGRCAPRLAALEQLRWTS